MVTPSIEKLTHLEDFQDPSEEGQNIEDDLSDDEVDPEAREQVVAEQSESDDEVLTSMEAGGDTQALGARLAAEVSVVCQYGCASPATVFTLTSAAQVVQDRAEEESDGKESRFRG